MKYSTAYWTNFFYNFNEFWTDFLQFSAKDGCNTPDTPPPPNVRPWILYTKTSNKIYLLQMNMNDIVDLQVTNC